MKYAVLVMGLAASAACSGGDKFSVEKLQDPNTCKDCHPKHFEQWSGSMHAYASEDPVFVAMNKRGQRETNGALGDFCLTCHAPMALKLGVASGASFDPATLSPEAKGITCYFCHNVEQVTDDHNAALTLAMDQTMRGGAKNPVDSPAHNSLYDPNMAGKTNNSTMCGSCHDLVTPEPLSVHLERSFAEWKTSIFALNDPTAFLPQTCSNCHMFPTDDVIADKPGLNVKLRQNGFHEHLWPAIDTALTPFPHMDAQKAGIMRDLTPAIAIKGIKPLGSTEAPGGICVQQDGSVTVRIDSFSVGHMFPSGAGQDRRMWLAIKVLNSSGTILFQRGDVPVDKDPEETTDPSLTTDCTFPMTNPTGCGAFFDRTYKTDGTTAHFFWEMARYDSHLIKPPITRDANSPLYDHSTTVKFNVGNVAQIDRVEAQLMMRPLPLAMLRELEQSGDLDASVRQQVQANPLTVGEKSIWTKATAGTGPAINTPCNPF